MNETLRNTYITSIYAAVTIVFDNYFGLAAHDIQIPSEGEGFILGAVEGDQIRIFPHQDSDDDDGYLKPLSTLDDASLVLVHQLINYEIIDGTSSVVQPVVHEDGTHEFELYQIHFDMSFEEYQAAETLEVGDLIDKFEEYQEALMQQRNMIS